MEASEESKIKKVARRVLLYVLHVMQTGWKKNTNKISWRAW